MAVPVRWDRLRRRHPSTLHAALVRAALLVVLALLLVEVLLPALMSLAAAPYR